MSRTATLADTTANTAEIAEPTAEVTSRRPIGRLFGLIAALLLSLLAPLVLNTTSANAATVTYHYRTGWEYDAARYIQSMINAERSAHHLPTLWMSSQLQSSARSHDYDMARWNTMSHQLPGEPYFGARMDRAGYHWTSAGENIAWTSALSYAGAAQVQNMMYNEVAPNDGHRLNILNPRFRAVGVDIWVDWIHRKIWLTTDFGTRAA